MDVSIASENKFPDEHDSVASSQDRKTEVDGFSDRIATEPPILTATEFNVLTVQESISKLQTRLEIIEDHFSYKETLKEKNDWFVFENRIREVVTDLLSPTMKRVEEARDRIRQTYEMSLDMNKVQTGFDQRINELNTDKVESFKYKVMEDLNSKYYAIKTECEKREQLLLNSMNLFEEKIDHLKGRITGINA